VPKKTLIIGCLTAFFSRERQNERFIFRDDSKELDPELYVSEHDIGTVFATDNPTKLPPDDRKDFQAMANSGLIAFKTFSSPGDLGILIEQLGAGGPSPPPAEPPQSGKNPEQASKQPTAEELILGITQAVSEFREGVKQSALKHQELLEMTLSLNDPLKRAETRLQQLLQLSTAINEAPPLTKKQIMQRLAELLEVATD